MVDYSIDKRLPHGNWMTAKQIIIALKNSGHSITVEYLGQIRDQLKWIDRGLCISNSKFEGKIGSPRYYYGDEARGELIMEVKKIEPELKKEWTKQGALTPKILSELGDYLKDLSSQWDLMENRHALLGDEVSKNKIENNEKFKKLENDNKKIKTELAKTTKFLYEERETVTLEDQKIKTLVKAIITHRMAKKGYEYNNHKYGKQQGLEAKKIADDQEEALGFRNRTRISFYLHQKLLKYYRNIVDEELIPY